MTKLGYDHFGLRVGDIKPQESVRRRLPNQIGFVPRNEAVYRAYNLVLASLLLLMVLPLLLGLSLLLLATQGREVFYRGPRLGRGKQVFHIIKFRTLNTVAAAALTRDQTLPQNSGLETPVGKFLRDTRLDELPQLLNVLFGDMNLCGPRPVRPEIAAMEGARIPRYDVRFHVKPGLVGPAQALMSHGTSKRIRALYNNIACRRFVSLRAEVALLIAIAWSVVMRTLVNGGVVLIAATVGGLRTAVRATRRRLQRLPGSHQPPAVTVTDVQGAVLEGGGGFAVARINDRGIVVPGLTLDEPAPAVLAIRIGGGGVRRARVLLEPTAARGTFAYAALSGASEYVIERYLLGLTVVRPPRGHRRPAAAPAGEGFDPAAASRLAGVLGKAWGDAARRFAGGRGLHAEAEAVEPARALAGVSG